MQTIKTYENYLMLLVQVNNIFNFLKAMTNNLILIKYFARWKLGTNVYI